MFLAWSIILVLWLRSLMRYGKIYRKYEQACREYEKTGCEPPEDLRLVQERLHQEEKRFGVLLQPLRRLGLLIGKESHNLAKVGKLDGDIRRAELLVHPTDNLGDLSVHKSRDVLRPNDQAEPRRADPDAAGRKDKQ